MRLSPTAVFSLAVLLGATAACIRQQVEEGTSPIRLDIPRSALPAPGLCRVWVNGLPVSQQPLSRGCVGIENTAPLGSRVLYRPDDGTRRLVVCHISTSHHGEIEGMDLFNINNSRLIRVLQRYGEDPPSKACSGALTASSAKEREDI